VSSPRGCLTLQRVQYALAVTALMAVHVANVVLIVLTVVWNRAALYGTDLAPSAAPPPALPAAFQLLGVSGNSQVGSGVVDTLRPPPLVLT
jgi:hypothetical protein